MNEKMPNKFIAREKPLLQSKFVPFVNENFSNKVVTEIDGDEEEDNPNEFQDAVLSCLNDLQNGLLNMKRFTDTMEEIIRRFRTSIHGEDIDAKSE